MSSPHSQLTSVITEQEYAILERFYLTDLYKPYFIRLIIKYLAIREFLDDTNS